MAAANTASLHNPCVQHVELDYFKMGRKFYWAQTEVKKLNKLSLSGKWTPSRLCISSSSTAPCFPAAPFIIAFNAFRKLFTQIFQKSILYRIFNFPDGWKISVPCQIRLVELFCQQTLIRHWYCPGDYAACNMTPR